jgi:hypothetical protein
MASFSNSDIILENPYTYSTWFAKIQGSVPRDLWKYFSPDHEDELREPESVTIGDIKDGARTLQDLSSTEKTIFAQLRAIYSQELTQYQRLLSEEAKLRERILKSVGDTKKSQLRADESIREWLCHLAESTKPTDSQMQEMIRSKHRVRMSLKYSEWPSGGPQKWISEWQKMMGECKQWCPSLYEQWISDFNLVWGEVQGAKFLCSQMRMDQKRGHSHEWSIYKASQELLDAWNERTIRSGMRQGGRPSSARAAFATEPLYNGEGIDQEEESEPKERTNKDRKNKRKPSPTEEEEDSPKRKPCWACDGKHQAKSCFLVKGIQPKKVKIPEENKEVFENRMKDPAFAKRIQSIRDLENRKVELLSKNPSQ